MNVAAAQQFVIDTRQRGEEQVNLANSAHISPTNTNTTVGIYEIQSFLQLLQMNQDYLNDTHTSWSRVTSRVAASDDAPTPYDTNTDLEAVLREAKSLSQQAIADMGEMARRGYVRYTEIISDVTGQMNTILTARSALARSTALVEARDELIESRPDAVSRITEVDVLAREAFDAIGLLLNAIRVQLTAMNSRTLTPPLTAAVNLFLHTPQATYTPSGVVVPIPRPSIVVLPPFNTPVVPQPTAQPTASSVSSMPETPGRRVTTGTSFPGTGKFIFIYHTVIVQN